jgi:adenine nucleotide transporter 17
MEAFWLGAFSKAVATIVTFPHVRAKVLEQSGVEKFKGMNSNSIITRLIITDGVTCLFSGMKIQLIKNVLASAIMLSTKERIESRVLTLTSTH